jgi:hypothetical protein
MLPTDRSRTGLISLWHRLRHKLRVWTRQEIVSDDPWDAETLFSESLSLSDESKPNMTDESKPDAATKATAKPEAAPQDSSD